MAQVPSYLLPPQLRPLPSAEPSGPEERLMGVGVKEMTDCHAHCEYLHPFFKYTYLY